MEMTNNTQMNLLVKKSRWEKYCWDRTKKRNAWCRYSPLIIRSGGVAAANTSEANSKQIGAQPVIVMIIRAGLSRSTELGRLLLKGNYQKTLSFNVIIYAFIGPNYSYFDLSESRLHALDTIV